MAITDRVMVMARLEFGWGSTDEIQDTGFWCAPYPTGSGGVIEWESAVDTIAAKVRDAWKAQMTPEMFPTMIVGRRVVTYAYVDDTSVRHATYRGEAAFDSTHAWAGTSSGALPPQNTVVLGTRAYEPGEYVENRGRRRGRMYLPTIQAGAVQNNGTLANGYPGIILGAAQGFFNAVSGAVDLAGGSEFHMRPVVLSRGGAAGAGAAQSYALIRSLAVGNIVDTQRRRRNRLDEAYVTGSINSE